MIEKYQRKKVLIQMLEHLFLTFSVFFIVSIVFAQFDWGLRIEDELKYLVTVLLFSLNDLTIRVLIFSALIMIERKRRKELKNITFVLIIEAICLLYNSFIFVLIIAREADIEIYNATGAIAAIATAVIIRVSIVMLMRRENR